MTQPRQHRQYHQMVGGPFGDTTYTKIFVGGLAWETQRDTMRRYFEQFGEILEAVVITDKNTGRSKGYGFVTFKDPDSAMRACQDPAPVIDGRRANCNLASLGAQQRPARPSTPQYGVARFRPVTPAALMAPGAYQGSSSAYFHQPGGHYAYPAYGYSGYAQENMYPMNYYNVYGGQQQYPPYYAAASASTPPGAYQNFYPFYAQGSQAQGYGIQYPQMVQYPYVPQQYSGTGILSVPASVASTTSNTTGVTTSPVSITITGPVPTSATSQTAAAAAPEHSSSPS